MKKILFALAVSFISYSGMAQCTVTVSTSQDSVACGECFDLTAEGNAFETLLFEDFNNSALGPGWTSNQTVLYNNPCGAPADGSPSAWFGNSSTQPRVLETIDYDLSCGGQICFNMKYATQAGASPCEGPDQPNEGVDLQYSLDGGATWVSIFYHTPLAGGYDPVQTQWNVYCHDIPPAAQTTSTRIRWYQDAGSGAGFDHWGIDDVEVNGTLCNVYYYDWFVDGTVDDADTTLCLDQSSQTYDVIFTDGATDTCSASITINTSLTADLLRDTTICGLIDYDLVANPINGSGTYDYSWNTGETTNTAENVTTGQYIVTVTDQNFPNCTVNDTVDFIMNIYCQKSNKKPHSKTREDLP